MKGEEFIRAIKLLSEEKGIPVEELFSYVEAALNAA